MSRGVGLGLAISKKLVELMGGTLSVQSVLHKGSDFSFSVRLEEIKKYVYTNEKRIVGYEGDSIIVLISEDLEQSGLFLTEILKALDFKVIHAKNGFETYQKALKYKPDIIFMNLIMPAMDGMLYIEKILMHPLLKKSLIVAVSANVLEETKKICFKAGCVDFIEKPVQIQTVYSIFEKQLSIKWIYGDTHSNNKEHSFYIPPEKELLKLRNFVKIGDIMGIRQWAISIKQVESKARRFADKIITLSDKFQINEIQFFLDNLERKP